MVSPQMRLTSCSYEAVVSGFSQYSPWYAVFTTHLKNICSSN